MPTDLPDLKDSLQRKPARLVLILDVRLASETQETILSALVPSHRLQVPQVQSQTQRTTDKCDNWLSLKDAARFLGLSCSTLYKYVSQRKIESRKLAGRLQFRQSELNRFVARQVRPARPIGTTRGIIHSALGSGK